MRHIRLRNESADYVAQREALRLAEINLTRQRERVAEPRRQLPEGAVVYDYAYLEGPRLLMRATGRSRACT